MTKVIAIVGSRSESRQADEWIKEQVRQIVTASKEKCIFVSGGASSGADFWCRYWCNVLKLPYLEAPAFWFSPHHKQATYGHGAADRSAGPRRNTTIADICTEAVAVWDGKSSGTKDLIDKVSGNDKPVTIIQWPPNLSQPKHYGKGISAPYVKLP